MLTLIFLTIAYFMRHRYFHENTDRRDKVIYYGMCVVLSPLFGPLLWKSLVDAKPAAPRERSSVVFPYVG